MKTLVVGFSKPAKFTLHGWIIMKADNAPYDHAYLRFHLDDIDREIVFQSIDVGVQLISQNQFESKSIPVEEYKLNVTDGQFMSMFQFCIDHSGREYSLWGVIGEGIRKLAAKMGYTINNPFDTQDKSDFCSEIIDRCLQQLDPGQFNINPDDVSPSDLQKIVSTLPQFTRIL